MNEFPIRGLAAATHTPVMNVDDPEPPPAGFLTRANVAMPAACRATVARTCTPLGLHDSPVWFTNPDFPRLTHCHGFVAGSCALPYGNDEYFPEDPAMDARRAAAAGRVYPRCAKAPVAYPGVPVGRARPPAGEPARVALEKALGEFADIGFLDRHDAATLA